MHDPSSRKAEYAGAARGLTPRALLWALGLTLLCVLWVRQVELITFTCQITESTPPIPGIAVLFFFALLYPVMNRVAARWQLSRAEVGVIYVFVSISSLMSAVGVTQAFLPYLTVPFYFATPENYLERFQPYLPDWLRPVDPEAIRTFFEGADGGVVPWGAWLLPLAWWLFFFLLYWWTATCLWALLRRRWADTERLTFPLLYIPLNLTEEMGPRSGERPFFRNPLMWLGFGVAALYNLTNILHAFQPGVPALGVFYPIGQLFTERPLSAMAGLQMWYRPELVGLGYLVSQEVLLSVWVFYLLQRLVSVLGLAVGWEAPGFPFEAEQGIGAYLAMTLFLLWAGRREWAAVLRKTLKGTPDPDDRDEPLPYRLAAPGLLLGFAGLVLFARAAGVPAWIGLLFFGLLFTCLLTYARIRAELGIPTVWALPHSQLKDVPYYTFGTAPFAPGGSGRFMAPWTQFYWLVHGGFYSQATVYQFESFQLAEALKMRRRSMVVVGMLAILVGLVLANVMFLTTYYQFGANVLAGGAESASGGVRVFYCLGAYTQTARYTEFPDPANVSKNIAAGVGAGIVLTLVVVRALLLRFPLAPLGYLMAAIIGSQLWWAFLCAWLAKGIVLRLGGVRLYKRLVPVFLGLALGHFFTAGIVWGSIASLWPDVRLIIWFT